MRFSYLGLCLSVVGLLTTAAHAVDMEKGKTLYSQRCATCHGEKGAGDGPIGASLPPEQKPRNFQQGGYKYATDDDKFKELIKKGGAAVGLSMLMPAQADLSDDDIESVLLYVHSLKTK